MSNAFGRDLRDLGKYHRPNLAALLDGTIRRGEELRRPSRRLRLAANVPALAAALFLVMASAAGGLVLLSSHGRPPADHVATIAAPSASPSEQQAASPVASASPGPAQSPLPHPSPTPRTVTVVVDRQHPYPTATVPVGTIIDFEVVASGGTSWGDPISEYPDVLVKISGRSDHDNAYGVFRAVAPGTGKILSSGGRGTGQCSTPCPQVMGTLAAATIYVTTS